VAAVPCRKRSTQRKNGSIGTTEEILVRRFAYCAAVATAALTATSGCGGDKSGDDTAASASSPAATTSALAAAYTNTVNAGSAALTFTGDVTAGATAGATVTHVAGKGQVSFTPPASTVTYTTKGTTNEVRTIGDTTYVRISGKGWRKTGTGATAGGDAPVDTTPVAGLSFLSGATATSPIGTATIHGEHATGYRVTVDLNKVAAAQRTPEEQQIYRSMAKATGAPTLPVDVWLDSHQRVTRERYEMSLGNGSSGRTSATIDLYDFGSPVKITPPPHG
jgi:hypothetical protein